MKARARKCPQTLMDTKDMRIRVATVDALLLSFGLHLEIQEGSMNDMEKGVHDSKLAQKISLNDSTAHVKHLGHGTSK